MNDRLVIGALTLALVLVGAGLTYAAWSATRLAGRPSGWGGLGVERAQTERSQQPPPAPPQPPSAPAAPRPPSPDARAGELRRTDLLARFNPFGGAGPRGTEAQQHEEQTLQVGANPGLRLQSPGGDAAVRAGDGGQMRIEWKKRAWGTDDADAQAQLEQTKVEIAQEADTVAIRVERPRSSGFGFFGRSAAVRVDFVLVVPPTTWVQLSNGTGAVRLEGVTGSAVVETVSGPVEARSSGDLSVRGGTGSITVMGARGTVDVRGVGGPISLADIEGSSLRVSTGTGSLELRDLRVENDLSVHAIAGPVTGQRLTAARLGVDAATGVVTLSEVTGRLDVKSVGGRVAISKAAANGVTIHAGTGAVTFSGTLSGDAPSSISTVSGPIGLALPADAAFRLDAATNGGRIRSDLPVTGATSTDPRRLVGAVNGGTVPLELRAGTGNIVVGVLQ
ncbi:MAG: DUF4097 family beta strand repeat protein [Chloroflexi bacterium]|nr:DUF4097 family beta strand repeat protein [Chloroflexota bacterium]